MQRMNNEYGTNTTIEPTETTGIHSFVFISLMCRYEFETLGATSDEMRLKAFYLDTDFIVVSLKT